MSLGSSRKDDQAILAAALSSILGKEILAQSDLPTGTTQHVSKISLFDQHLTSFVYGKVGGDETVIKKSLMNLSIIILSTKTTTTYSVERDATVDKLKYLIYEREGIPCVKQNLIFSGQEIDDGHKLNEYGIEDSSTIYVVRLRAYNANDLLVLDAHSLDPGYDYDFTNITDENKRFVRGGVEYRRPCGYRRFAIRVEGKFENEVWLGCTNGPGEWPVCYHGTGRNAAQSIAQRGYDLSKHKRFHFGHGIYSTPDIEVAEAYAKQFDINGEKYLIILQNRVNPKTLTKLEGDKTGDGQYWISPTSDDIRPYGICIKKRQ